MAERIIRDPGRRPDLAREYTQDAIAAERARLVKMQAVNARVLGPYGPRDLMAGDPASPSGVTVAESELDDALIAKMNAAGQVLEVVLTFPDTLAPGTPFNIHDGTYPGGGPAQVEGDRPDFPNVGDLGVTLPPTAAEYYEDGRIRALQEPVQPVERSRLRVCFLDPLAIGAGPGARADAIALPPASGGEPPGVGHAGRRRASPW